VPLEGNFVRGTSERKIKAALSTPLTLRPRREARRHQEVENKRAPGPKGTARKKKRGNVDGESGQGESPAKKKKKSRTKGGSVSAETQQKKPSTRGKGGIINRLEQKRMSGKKKSMNPNGAVR